MGAAEAEAKLQGRTFLAPEQLSELRRDARQHEWAVHGLSSFDGQPVEVNVGGRSPEPELAAEQLAKINAMIEAGTPPPVNELERSYLYRRTKELEAEISHYMPTEEMMERPTATNIDAHSNWERHNQFKIPLWKAMRRTVDPDNDDPNFTNVEILRQPSGVLKNPRQYWEGFNNIAFSTAIELRDATVDEPLYLEFLKYKALEWSDRGIMRHVGMTQVQFELCTQRWLKDKAERPPEPEDEPALEMPGEPEGPTGAEPQDVTRPPETAPTLDDSWLAIELHECGVSKSRLAKDTGVHNSTINKILAGDEVALSLVKRVKDQLRKYRQQNGRRAQMARKAAADLVTDSVTA